MLLAPLARVAPVILGGALRIQSEVACPDPAEVSANVRNLVELSDESAATLSGAARRDGSWLVLSLLESNGTSLGDRRVPYDADCATLARAAAVVFSAWISNEHPEFLVALPSEGPAPANPSPVAPTPTAAPSPPPAAVIPPSALPRAPSRSTPSANAPPLLERAPPRFVAGAGLGGTISTSSAPAATLSAAWDPGRLGWGARASLAWLGTRSESLNEREVSWTRWPLLLGPFLRLRAGHASIDLEAGGAVAWVRLRGHGFETEATDSGVTAGGYAALRFMLSDAPLHPFVMAAPLYWFHNATAVATDATGAAVTRSLPPLEVLLTLGAELSL